MPLPFCNRLFSRAVMSVLMVGAGATIAAAKCP